MNLEINFEALEYGATILSDDGTITFRKRCINASDGVMFDAWVDTRLDDKSDTDFNTRVLMDNGEEVPYHRKMFDKPLRVVRTF